MNYYFFAASLPALTPDEQPPLSPEAFLAQCREYLRAADADAVAAVLDEGPPSRQRFVRDWGRKERQLRNAIVHHRAPRLGRDPEADVRPEPEFDGSVARLVGEAFLRPSPIDRERALDRVRWAQAEALGGYNPFSIDGILAYAVKLKLACRWAALDEETGRQTAEAIIGQPAPD
jgi:hypothetical protein